MVCRREPACARRRPAVRHGRRRPRLAHSSRPRRRRRLLRPGTGAGAGDRRRIASGSARDVMAAGTAPTPRAGLRRQAGRRGLRARAVRVHRAGPRDHPATQLRSGRFAPRVRRRRPGPGVRPRCLPSRQPRPRPAVPPGPAASAGRAELGLPAHPVGTTTSSWSATAAERSEHHEPDDAVVPAPSNPRCSRRAGSRTSTCGYATSGPPQSSTATSADCDRCSTSPASARSFPATAAATTTSRSCRRWPRTASAGRDRCGDPRLVGNHPGLNHLGFEMENEAALVRAHRAATAGRAPHPNG